MYAFRIIKYIFLYVDESVWDIYINPLAELKNKMATL